MTRNDFIQARVAAALDRGSFDKWTVHTASLAADELEKQRCATWLTPPAPALDPLIERAHLFATFCACGEYAAGDMKSRAQAWLADYDAASRAVRAYKESAK